MAIHPIDFRYGTPEMKQIWEEDFRLRCLFKVEAALARAEEEVGLLPTGIAADIAAAAEAASPARAKQIEDEIGHDMMATVLAMAEVCPGGAGEWIHLGATSNDILDTATGLQIKASLDVLEPKLKKLLSVLLDLAVKNKDLVCAGRTHGQIAVPTTYGLRFAIWASEVARHIERLQQLRPRAAVGKTSGAVGTQAAYGPKGMEIQSLVMKHLGLNEVDVSNQVVQRDRHAEMICWMAIVATTLDKIFTEIRTLQRTEIAEVEEGFGKKQVGSSRLLISWAESFSVTALCSNRMSASSRFSSKAFMDAWRMISWACCRPTPFLASSTITFSAMFKPWRSVRFFSMFSGLRRRFVKTRMDRVMR